MTTPMGSVMETMTSEVKVTGSNSHPPFGLLVQTCQKKKKKKKTLRSITYSYTINVFSESI
jgi:hypothetical protein